MRTVIQRFLSFQAENVGPEIYGALGLVYLLLLAVSLASVARLVGRRKLAWMLLICFVPLFGMYAYALYSLVRADYSFFKRFGLSACSAEAVSKMSPRITSG